MRIFAITTLLFITFFCKSLNGQFLINVNSVLIFPVGENNGRLIDFGPGVDLNIGYSFSNYFDIGLCFEQIWPVSVATGYRVSSLRFNAKYFLLHDNIRPFAGVTAGWYRDGFDEPFQLNSRINSNGLGGGPNFGVQFFLYKNLWVNTNVYYSVIYTDPRTNALGAQLGLLKYF